RGTLDNPTWVDLESGCVKLTQVGGNAVDAGKAAVEILKIGDHDFVPQVALFQIAHQRVVDDSELTRQVGLDVEVAVVGFDAWRHADNIGDGGGRRNGDAVGVAHAVLLDVSAQAVPVKRAAVINLDVAATLFAQHGQRVLRQYAAIPQGPLESLVMAAFGSQLAGSPVGVIASCFHGTIGKLDRSVRRKRYTHHLQAVLEAHDAHANGAMAHVGVACFLDRVIVDVD